jgi:BirA family biotin operon repressor/biotin-[acetyl-CoA-carboxylase] ligase
VIDNPPLPIGIEVLHFATIDSTNDEARRQADSGVTGALWIRADRQTKGRGRRGRSWLSDPGNLFMTGLITLDCSPAQAANLSFLTALAVAEALDHFIDPHIVKLKWPNDVLINDAKTSGILLESWTSQTGLHLAIGIGINILTKPDNVEQAVTCVSDNVLADDTPCDAATLFIHVLHHFHIRLAQWHEHGFEPVRGAWLSRAKGLGKPIVARLPQETLEGTFIGLRHDGALELELGSGDRRFVTAGDVFFGG